MTHWRLVMVQRWIVVAGLVLFMVSGVSAGPAAAQESQPDASGHASRYEVYPLTPVSSVHRVTINGEEVLYMATAEMTPLVGEDYEPDARVFTISYRRLLREPTAQELAFPRGSVVVGVPSGPQDAPNDLFPDPSTRPITFSFNGGPGSSSVWLHMGLFGPKRVSYADEAGLPGPPPYAAIENAYSLLDKSDFVFIDPVSTGYSRAAVDDDGKTDAKPYHGVESDVASVAEVIRRHLAREGRWASPKYIAGESYGTTRAAALSEHLWGRHNVALNGIILVSAVMDFGTIRFNAGHDLPYVCFLPTYTAVAHYHGKLGEPYAGMPVADAVAASERTALGMYASALMQGDGLTGEERSRVAETLSGLTGLSAEFIQRSNLRVSMSRFAKELLRDEGRTVGRFDGRFLGLDRDDAGESYSYDASHAAIRANYTESFNGYVREELGWRSDLPYEILTSVWPWDYGSAGNNRFVNVAERLRNAMHQQPHLRVFLASGYYDLATPHLGADYTVGHMFIGEERRENLETHYYEGGHMMYLHEPSLGALKADLDAFYDAGGE
ncbi:MAG: peptidase S10 [Planctomycetota bacterium]